MLGNGIKARQSGNEVINYIKDGNGNILKMQNSQGKEEEYQYDVYGKMEINENDSYHSISQIIGAIHPYNITVDFSIERKVE